MLVPLACVAIVIRLAVDELAGQRRSILAATWKQRCGEVSYALYLVQLLPRLALRRSWFVPTICEGTVVLAVAWITTTLATAVVLHRAVEVPAARLLRRIG